VEADDAWFAFVAYRDACPTRRVDRVEARNVRVPTQTAMEWYRAHAWAERAAAWDAHLDGIRQEEAEAQVREDAQAALGRHKKLLRMAYDLADRELSKILEASRATDAPGTVKMGELVRLLDSVVRLERLLHGQTTESISANLDFGALTVEELRQIQTKLKEKKDDPNQRPLHGGAPPRA
jgi:hypothetical protein